MNTIEQKITELNQLVLSGKMIEAFEKIYHDDVQMQENTSLPVVGKEANRKRELEFPNNISEFRSASVLEWPQAIIFLLLSGTMIIRTRNAA